MFRIDSPPAANNSLMAAISRLEHKLELAISKPEGEKWWDRWRDRWWYRREITPEKRRVLGVIHETLGELRRLHALQQGVRPYDAQALDQSLVEVIERQDVTSLSIPAAWEYALRLQRLLLLIGDRHYVKTQLMNEWQIENTRPDYIFKTWSYFFDKAALETLVESYKDDAVAEGDPAHRQAVEYLTHLSVARNSTSRNLAMNANTRTLYIDRLTWLLAGLLLLLLAVIYVASHGVDSFRTFNLLSALWNWNLKINLSHPDFKHALIAAATGAVGSALSGFYMLRDKVKFLHDLRTFRAAMWAQPFVGAIAGILVFLILRSGVLGLQLNVGGEWWPAFAMYGFLAGYSEPFFLGLVSRAAGTIDDKDKPDEKGEKGEKGNKGDKGGGALTSPPSSPPN